MASSSNFMNNFFLRAGTHFFFGALRRSTEPKKITLTLISISRIHGGCSNVAQLVARLRDLLMNLTELKWV